MSPPFAALVLDRPFGLLALAAIPLAWWLARRLDVPRERVTGALALWRAAAPAEAGAAARPRPPAGFAWLVLALAAAALALAAPRRARAPEAFVFVVDRSPSTYLPAGEGGTRLDAALARAEALRAELGADRVLWASPGEATAAGASCPPAWTAPPPAPRPEPDWRAHDRADAVWVTDAAPPDRARAGLAASGGRAVPGPVGGLGRRVVVWDGEDLREREEPGAEARVALDPALPAPVADVARAWAEARGLDVVAATGALAGTPLLRVLAAESDAAPEAVRAGRDGWEASGAAVAAAGPGEPWLVATSAEGAQRVLVRALHPGGESAGGAAADGAGTVVVGWRELDEPRGDPAAFAVSWAELLDRVAAPPAGAVALAERVAAGAGRTELPAAARGGGTRGTARGAPTAAATVAAAAAAALWAFSRSRGRRTSRPPRSAA